MSLGEKLLRARQEAGLSQRQLCGEEITRNMLSQIEHGTAKPSMSTLMYLARRLGKPVGFFLEEDAAASQNQKIMEAAWAAYESGDFMAAAHALEQFQFPDEIYDREYRLLNCLNHLALAERALDQGKKVYAAELLERVRELEQRLLWLPELRIRRGRLLGRMSGEIPAECLPNPDPDLRLLAQAALTSGDAERASRLLDACEDQNGGCWNLLRGRAAMGQKDYSGAAEFYRRAEEHYPDQAIPALEFCYRELGDYKMAYHYACIARERK